MSTPVAERPGKASDWEDAESLQAEALRVESQLARTYERRAEAIKRLAHDGAPISLIARELGITRLPIYRALGRTK